uniref:Uncharacterized protein n=1 Tax=Cacopsylla melanoneura TaxID=428564 RepID=A0A8D8UU99_9HEMI
MDRIRAVDIRQHNIHQGRQILQPIRLDFKRTTPLLTLLGGQLPTLKCIHRQTSQEAHILNSPSQIVIPPPHCLHNTQGHRKQLPASNNTAWGTLLPRSILSPVNILQYLLQCQPNNTL